MGNVRPLSSGPSALQCRLWRMRIMPLVKIYMRGGRNEEYRRSVSEEIHAALVSEANIPKDDRFHVIQEVAAEDLLAHGSYGGVERTDALLIIEITLNAGRTVDVKRNLYRRIAQNLERNPGVRPDDVLVSLVEVTKE